MHIHSNIVLELVGHYFSDMQVAGRETIKMAAVAAIVAVVMMMFMGGAVAQSTASCTSTLISLSPCLSYITSNTSTSPAASCCTQLASVVASRPRCLCLVLNGQAAAGLGLTIDRNRALALPLACKVQTPPASACDANSPAASPATQGSEGSESSAASASTPSSKLLCASLLAAASYFAPFTMTMF